MCSSKHKSFEMVCKEDIIVWFKDLESYKRIDTMCALLNMCLPFELRFLGTCLEELGRRDAQELRGVELRVNNPQEFGSDIQECYGGELSEKKVRRRMALYLALLRATLHRNCINDLFKALEQWGDRDYTKFADGDPLQELLLVYTMAANHPIFTLEQRSKCGAILVRIKESKQVDAKQSPLQASSMQQPPHMQPQFAPQQQIPPSSGYQQTIPNYAAIHNATTSSTPPPPQSSNAGQSLPASTFQMMAHYSASPMPQIISTDNLPPHLAIEALSTMQLQPNMTIPADFSIPPPNTIPWQLRPGFVNPSFSTVTVQMDNSFHQSTSSPMLSQPSSPSHSRTTSPTRLRSGADAGGNVNTTGNVATNSGGRQQQGAGSGQQQQQQRGSRTSRRPSSDTTPPPPQQQQNQIITMVGESDVISQNIKGFDDVTNVDGTINQMQALRNGYTRPTSHTIPRHATGKQQQQQQAVYNAATATGLLNQSLNSSYQATTGLTYAFQNMNLVDLAAMHHPPPGLPQATTHVVNSSSGSSSRQHGGGGGTGSDSGSSVGSGDISPPETPSLGTTTSSTTTTSRAGGRNNNSGGGVNRINGRSDNNKSSSQSGQSQQGTTTSNVTGSVIYPTVTSGGTGQQQFATELAPSASSSNLSNNSQQQQQSTGVASVPPGTAATTVILAPSATGAGGQIVNNVLLQQHALQSAPTAATLPQFTTSFPPYGHALTAAALGRGGAQILSHTGVPTATGVATSAFRHHGATFAPTLQQTSDGQLLYFPTMFMSHPTPPPPPRSSPSAVPQQVVPIPAVTVATSLLQTPNAVPALPTNKQSQSCYNCGSTAHHGRECQESSMEDVQRSYNYKLDYTMSTMHPTVSMNSTAVAAAVTRSSTQQQQQQHYQASETSVQQSQQQQQQPIDRPKIKPLFNPAEILPQRREPDEEEIISLLSSDSSNDSNSSSK